MTVVCGIVKRVMKAVDLLPKQVTQNINNFKIRRIIWRIKNEFILRYKKPQRWRNPNNIDAIGVSVAEQAKCAGKAGLSMRPLIKEDEAHFWLNGYKIDIGELVRR